MRRKGFRTVKKEHKDCATQHCSVSEYTCDKRDQDNKNDVKFLVKTHLVGIEENFNNLLRGQVHLATSSTAKKKIQSILGAYPVLLIANSCAF